MSYLLTKNTNLGDVFDTDESRYTLNVGPLEKQNADNVLLDGKIKVTNLQVKLMSAEKTIPYSSYVKSLDDKGTLYWYIYDDWLRNNDNIRLSDFFLDISFVPRCNIDDSVFSALFQDLKNVPTTSDFFKDLYDSTFLVFHSNLQDIGHINKDDISVSLGIGDISYQNNDLLIVKDLVVEKFYYHNIDTNKNMNNCYLRSENDNVLVNGLRTNKTKWYDLFLNDNGSLKNEFILQTSYNTNISNNTVTANTLKEMYNNAYEFTREQYNNIDMYFVKETLSNYAKNSVFLVTECNLKNDDLDLLMCRQNLDIGTVGEQDGSNITFENANINNHLKLDLFQGEVYDNTFFVIQCVNTNGNIQLVDIKTASENTFGFVNYAYDFTSANNSSNSVISWKTINDVNIDLSSKVEELYQMKIVNSLLNFTNDIGTFVDSNMSQFQSLLTWTELEPVYDALKLSKMSYTGDFNDMNKPTSIISFKDDVLLMKKYHNCYGLNTSVVLNSLGCSTIGQQNNNNVDISNGTSSLHTTSAYKTLTLYPYELGIDESKWLKINDDYNIQYTELPIASSNIHGMVQKKNRYDMAQDNACVTIQSFNNMYKKLNEQINILDRQIYSFLTGEVTVTTFDEITNETTVTVTQADGSSVATVTFENTIIRVITRSKPNELHLITEVVKYIDMKIMTTVFTSTYEMITREIISAPDINGAIIITFEDNVYHTLSKTTKQLNGSSYEVVNELDDDSIILRIIEVSIPDDTGIVTTTSLINNPDNTITNSIERTNGYRFTTITNSENIIIHSIEVSIPDDTGIVTTTSIIINPNNTKTNSIEKTNGYAFTTITNSEDRIIHSTETYVPDPVTYLVTTNTMTINEIDNTITETIEITNGYRFTTLKDDENNIIKTTEIESENKQTGIVITTTCEYSQNSKTIYETDRANNILQETVIVPLDDDAVSSITTLFDFTNGNTTITEIFANGDQTITVKNTLFDTIIYTISKSTSSESPHDITTVTILTDVSTTTTLKNQDGVLLTKDIVYVPDRYNGNITRTFINTSVNFEITLIESAENILLSSSKKPYVTYYDSITSYDFNYNENTHSLSILTDITITSSTLHYYIVSVPYKLMSIKDSIPLLNSLPLHHIISGTLNSSTSLRHYLNFIVHKNGQISTLESVSNMFIYIVLSQYKINELVDDLKFQENFDYIVQEIPYLFVEYDNLSPYVFIENVKFSPFNSVNYVSGTVFTLLNNVNSIKYAAFDRTVKVKDVDETALKEFINTYGKNIKDDLPVEFLEIVEIIDSLYSNINDFNDVINDYTYIINNSFDFVVLTNYGDSTNYSITYKQFEKPISYISTLRTTLSSCFFDDLENNIKINGYVKPDSTDDTTYYLFATINSNLRNEEVVDFITKLVDVSYIIKESITSNLNFDAVELSHAFDIKSENTIVDTRLINYANIHLYATNSNNPLHHDIDTFTINHVSTDPYITTSFIYTRFNDTITLTDMTLFYSFSDIDYIYRPLLFTSNVDLTNTELLKTEVFGGLSGLDYINTTPIIQNSIGNLTSSVDIYTAYNSLDLSSSLHIIENIEYSLLIASKDNNDIINIFIQNIVPSNYITTQLQTIITSGSINIDDNSVRLSGNIITDTGVNSTYYIFATTNSTLTNDQVVAIIDDPLIIITNVSFTDNIDIHSKSVEYIYDLDHSLVNANQINYVNVYLYAKNNDGSNFQDIDRLTITPSTFLPYITQSVHYSRFDNIIHITDITIFSGYYNIVKIYQPIAFAKDTDLTNSEELKTFLSSLPLLDSIYITAPVTKGTIGQLTENINVTNYYSEYDISSSKVIDENSEYIIVIAVLDSNENFGYIEQYIRPSIDTLTTLRTELSTCSLDYINNTIKIVGNVIPDTENVTIFYLYATTSPHLTNNDVRKIIQSTEYSSSIISGQITSTEYLIDSSLQYVHDLNSNITNIGHINFTNVYLYATNSNINSEFDDIDQFTISPTQTTPYITLSNYYSRFDETIYITNMTLFSKYTDIHQIYTPIALLKSDVDFYNQDTLKDFIENNIQFLEHPTSVFPMKQYDVHQLDNLSISFAFTSLDIHSTSALSDMLDYIIIITTLNSNNKIEYSEHPFISTTSMKSSIKTSINLCEFSNDNILLTGKVTSYSNNIIDYYAFVTTASNLSNAYVREFILNNSNNLAIVHETTLETIDIYQLPISYVLDVNSNLVDVKYINYANVYLYATNSNTPSEFDDIDKYTISPPDSSTEPYLTHETYFSRFNNTIVIKEASFFSSYNDINIIYKPILFESNVDLLENNLKMFFNENKSTLILSDVVISKLLLKIEYNFELSDVYTYLNVNSNNATVLEDSNYILVTAVEDVHSNIYFQQTLFTTDRDPVYTSFSKIVFDSSNELYISGNISKQFDLQTEWFLFGIVDSNVPVVDIRDWIIDNSNDAIYSDVIFNSSMIDETTTDEFTNVKINVVADLQNGSSLNVSSLNALTIYLYGTSGEIDGMAELYINKPNNDVFMSITVDEITQNITNTLVYKDNTQVITTSDKYDTLLQTINISPSNEKGEVITLINYENNLTYSSIETIANDTITLQTTEIFLADENQYVIHLTTYFDDSKKEDIINSDNILLETKTTSTPNDEGVVTIFTKYTNEDTKEVRIKESEILQTTTTIYEYILEEEPYIKYRNKAIVGDASFSTQHTGLFSEEEAIAYLLENNYLLVNVSANIDGSANPDGTWYFKTSSDFDYTILDINRVPPAYERIGYNLYLNKSVAGIPGLVHKIMTTNYLDQRFEQTIHNSNTNELLKKITKLPPDTNGNTLMTIEEIDPFNYYTELLDDQANVLVTSSFSAPDVNTSNVFVTVTFPNKSNYYTQIFDEYDDLIVTSNYDAPDFETSNVLLTVTYPDKENYFTELYDESDTLLVTSNYSAPETVSGVTTVNLVTVYHIHPSNNVSVVTTTYLGTDFFESNMINLVEEYTEQTVSAGITSVEVREYNSLLELVKTKVTTTDTINTTVTVVETYTDDTYSDSKRITTIYSGEYVVTGTIQSITDESFAVTIQDGITNVTITEKTSTNIVVKLTVISKDNNINKTTVTDTYFNAVYPDVYSLTTVYDGIGVNEDNIESTTTEIAPYVGLLDNNHIYTNYESDYTHLRGGYAVKHLYTEYTGPHIRIKRSSDSGELDVTFDTNGVLTEYYEWIGTDIANVVTWYDQSTNGNHATAFGTVTFDYTNKRVVLGPDGYFELPNGTVPYGDDPYTMILDHGESKIDSRGNINGTLVYSGKAYAYNNFQGNCIRVNNSTFYNSIWHRGNGADLTEGYYRPEQVLINVCGTRVDGYVDREIYAYVDGINGQQQSTNTNVNTAIRQSLDINNYIGVWINSDTSGKQWYWNGEIYTVLIYDKSLEYTDIDFISERLRPTS